MEDIEEKFSNMALFKREINKPTIFRDIHKLEASYIPEKLYFRNEILKQLIHTYKRSIKKGHSVSCVLMGPCGSGKTAIAKNFAHHFKYAIYKEQPEFLVEYYNCIEFRTKSQILRNVVSKYHKGSGRGYSDEEMWQILIRHLKNRKGILFLIVDEVQILKPHDILAFLNAGENFGNKNARLSILFLSRTKDWMELEKERILSRLNERIEILPYTWEESFEILKLRSEEAFKEGIITEEALQKITDLTVETSNLRHGIEILRKAGLYTELKGFNNIPLDFIDEVKKEVYSPFRAEIIDKLRDHELLALLATLQVLREQEIAHLNDVYPIYKMLCNKYCLPPHVKMSFRAYIRTLRSLNLFHSERTKVDLPRGRCSVLSFSKPHIPTFFEFELQIYLNKRFGGIS